MGNPAVMQRNNQLPNLGNTGVRPNKPGIVPQEFGTPGPAPNLIQSMVGMGAQPPKPEVSNMSPMPQNNLIRDMISPVSLASTPEDGPMRKMGAATPQLDTPEVPPKYSDPYEAAKQKRLGMF